VVHFLADISWLMLPSPQVPPQVLWWQLLSAKVEETTKEAKETKEETSQILFCSNFLRLP
jgi:hypothetical protein